MPELLFEIGTEEVPAGYIGRALEQMKSLFSEALKSESLAFDQIYTTGTPRRLVFWADGIPEQQPDRTEEVSGPPAKAAFDAEGKPTRAAEGFAKAQGVSVDKIEVRETKKGQYCFAIKRIQGKSATEILETVLPTLIERIGFPKSMVWGNKARPKNWDFRFARPIRSLVALFGDRVVKIKIAGVESGRCTKGHPFLAPAPIELASADIQAYKESLRRSKVIVDLKDRRKKILDEVERLGGTSYTYPHNPLVEEVTNLVEYPTVMVGSFDKEHLAIPGDVIEAAMMEHQRYFPVRNPNGDLEPRFIFVANRGPEHGEVIRTGNERVLRARLADAKFFWDEDRKAKLEERLEALKEVQFMADLGEKSSYYEKTLRLERLARHIAGQLGKDVKSAVTAARLCKCDLVTGMVKEFPSLQGIMGGEYAREEGYPEAVWRAIQEHYLRGAFLYPDTANGCILSLADKFDNVASCFIVGKRPTGSQDPFALRRQVLGIITIFTGRKWRLRLRDLTEQTLSGLGCDDPHLTSEILGFIRDRLYQHCLDMDVPHDIINAVIATGFDDIPDFLERFTVVRAEAQKDHWNDLVFLVQRSANVAKIGEAAERVDESLFEQDAERELWRCFSENKGEIEKLIQNRDYAAASARYCEAFSRAVHEFFDKVFVNVENERVKKNRIRMVKEINELYSRNIADLSQIIISGTGAKR